MAYERRNIHMKKGREEGRKEDRKENKSKGKSDSNDKYEGG